MEHPLWVDGRSIDGRTLEADVCVIGSGPAGLSLVQAFASTATRVVVIESGGATQDSRIQRLAAGRTRGDRYPAPSRSRSRRAGGTAHIWNTWVGSERVAKYAPLDPIDFECREWVPHSGWPVRHADLVPWYARARRLCGLEPVRDQPVPGDPADALFAGDAGAFTPSLYQLGAARRFTHDLVGTLREAPNVMFCTHATALGLDSDPTGESIVAVRAGCLGGERFQVRATCFVLAAGGIENPRLLLLSRRGDAAAPGNRFDLVGRGLMDHPRDFASRLIPRDPRLVEQLGFYDVHCTPAGALRGRLAVREETMRRNRTLNLSVTLRRRPAWIAHGWSDLLPTRMRARARSAVARLECLGPAAVPRVEIELNLEQAPDLENRVMLGRNRDAFGLPRAEVHWRWREIDRASHAHLRTLLANEFESRGIGRLEVRAGLALDPAACHPTGTTRMSASPEGGVVDTDARVHGVSNLFVAGSSVFPTSGFANPTLTIVALALRLADHLRRRFVSEPAVSAATSSPVERLLPSTPVG